MGLGLCILVELELTGRLDVLGEIMDHGVAGDQASFSGQVLELLALSGYGWLHSSP